ncbi:AAA family ATPase [Streptomyces sp. URMC 123]|uniref:AAA family ATPase n=1 Tax=Streptomyces sp. URMC 123 TaxID=3423403 RepID=UPI003F196C19
MTGMSGVGKSTVLARLEQRGYRTVDTDVGGWIENAPLPDGTGMEPQWREDRIEALIAEHEHSGEPLFIGGTVLNQQEFYPRFKEIVLLSAPLSTMLERVATRSTNPYGRTAEERDRIVADTAEVEPLLRSSATVEIDTRRPIDEVVDHLASLAAMDRGTAGTPHAGSA